MGIKETLDSIVERHPDVIGALVSHGDMLYHNLESPYDMISGEKIMQILADIFGHSEMLEGDGLDFTEIMIEFDTHSLIVRAIEDGLLAVLAPRLQRGQLVKLHVSLALFGKAVEKALAEQEPEPAAAAPASAPAAAPAATAAPEPAPEAAAKPRFQKFAGKLARWRGGEAAAAQEAPAPQNAADVPDGEVPLRPDGTPMKKRMYRGVEFYE